MPSSLYTVSAHNQVDIIEMDLKMNIFASLISLHNTELDHEIKHKRDMWLFRIR